MGYYDPTLTFLFYKSFNKRSDDLLVIKVEPGPPIIVVKVNLIIHGDGEKDIDYQNMIKESKLFVGKQLNHNDYEQFKNKISSLALFKGYFDAKFKKSQLVVIPSLCQSIWNINFYSGQRYVFERIRFRGSHIKEDYLRNISNICIGEYYSATSIVELNNRLFSTNWFELISIFPDYTYFQQKKK